MKYPILALLWAAAFATALGSVNLRASRLEKAETTSFHDNKESVCAGCRIYVESTRGGPMRLDRRPPMDSSTPLNACADTGVSAWFPEEGEHLAAFLNSRSAKFK